MSDFNKVNHFEKVGVSSTEFKAYSRWQFNSTSFFIFVEAESADDTIEYSFSGKDVHGEINPTYFQGVFFDNRTCSIIYFRRKFSGSNVFVRVESWKA